VGSCSLPSGGPDVCLLTAVREASNLLARSPGHRWSFVCFPGCSLDGWESQLSAEVVTGARPLGCRGRGIGEGNRWMLQSYAGSR